MKKFDVKRDGFNFQNRPGWKLELDMREESIQEFYKKDPFSQVITFPAEIFEDLSRLGRAIISLFMPLGYCYGMSSLASHYYNNPKAILQNKTTYQLKVSKIESQIKLWQYSQLLSPTFIIKSTLALLSRIGIIGFKDYFFKLNEFSLLRHYINRAPVLCLCKPMRGHAVVAYRIIPIGKNRYTVQIYDPNFPEKEREIEINLEKRGLGFDYKSYKSFFTLIPDETMIGVFLDTFYKRKIAASLLKFITKYIF
jgi:hypothetical protein